jgi:hypothetical protein
LTAVKKKSEDAESAQVACDKEHELLHKKVKETNVKPVHPMPMLGDSSSVK